MNTLVIYDSAFGNTKQVAKAIAEGISGKTKLINISDANMAEMIRFDLIIIGSPTQGGRPTKEISEFINEIPGKFLNGVKVAAFDTRFLESGQGLGLRLLMKTIGYASAKIAKSLQKKGAILVENPQGFIVEGKEGPLRKGELERTKNWAKEVQEGLESD